MQWNRLYCCGYGAHLPPRSLHRYCFPSLAPARLRRKIGRIECRCKKRAVFLSGHVNGRLYTFWLQPTGGEAGSADYTGTCCRRRGQGKVLIRVTLGRQRLCGSNQKFCWGDAIPRLISDVWQYRICLRHCLCAVSFDRYKKICHHVIWCPKFFFGGACKMLKASDLSNDKPESLCLNPGFP